MKQSVAEHTLYAVSADPEAVVFSDRNNNTPHLAGDFGMQDIAYELQENIGQTAACVKLLLASLLRDGILPADKLDMMDKCMKILIHDIRSLTTRVIQNTDK